MKTRSSTATPRHSRPRGFTMVELLVAMVLSMLMALAAVASVVIARQGFTTVDAASQLRDNGRFVADLIQRVVVQTGYQDVVYATATRENEFNTVATSALPEPFVFGFNNKLVAANPLVASSTPGLSGSDVLILRYQSSETVAGSGVADKTMIDCAGVSAAAPKSRNERIVSAFHVALVNSEPTLICSSGVADAAGNVTWSTAGPQPIVSGIETFQVLYGTDGVTPGGAPVATIDSVPDRFLRADELTVPGNTVATYANWARVRSVRIGIVLRAAANSANESDTQIRYPLGQALSSANDAFSIYPAQNDQRLRQVAAFTVYLRNTQSQTGLTGGSP
jgi:type IV pilus assembly protein PilW